MSFRGAPTIVGMRLLRAGCVVTRSAEWLAALVLAAAVVTTCGGSSSPPATTSPGNPLACEDDDDCMVMDESSLCCPGCCPCPQATTRAHYAELQRECEQMDCGSNDCHTTRCEPCGRIERAVCESGTCIGR